MTGTANEAAATAIMIFRIDILLFRFASTTRFWWRHLPERSATKDSAHNVTPSFTVNRWSLGDMRNGACSAGLTRGWLSDGYAAAWES
jgi:hypothetical protein